VSKKVLTSLLSRLRSALQREEGQGMVEYALILVLVSIVVILILSLLGGTLQNVFSDIVKGL
jgi:pilus assembly protein Flp/PilA